MFSIKSFFLLMIFGILSSLVVQPTQGQMADRLAQAIRDIPESFGGNEGEPFMKLMEDRSNKISRNELVHDPYPSWLTARLIHLAVSKKLFESKSDSVKIRIPIRVGTNEGKDRFILVVEQRLPRNELKRAGEPVLLFDSIGKIVDGEGELEDMYDDLVELEDVSHGDLVQLNIYRIPQDEIIEFKEEDENQIALKLLDSPNIELIIRTCVPVLVR